MRALFQRKQIFKLTRPKQAPQGEGILQTEMHETIELTVPAVSRSNRSEVEVDHSRPCKLQLTMQSVPEGKETEAGRSVRSEISCNDSGHKKTERLDVPQAMKTARQTSH